jgi:hypothetical protein
VENTYPYQEQGITKRGLVVHTSNADGTFKEMVEEMIGGKCY